MAEKVTGRWTYKRGSIGDCEIARGLGEYAASERNIFKGNNRSGSR